MDLRDFDDFSGKCILNSRHSGVSWGKINIVRRGRGTNTRPRVLPMRIIRAIRGCAVESAVPSGVLD